MNNHRCYRCGDRRDDHPDQGHEFYSKAEVAAELSALRTRLQAAERVVETAREMDGYATSHESYVALCEAIATYDTLPAQPASVATEAANARAQSPGETDDQILAATVRGSAMLAERVEYLRKRVVELEAQVLRSQPPSVCSGSYQPVREFTGTLPMVWRCGICEREVPAYHTSAGMFLGLHPWRAPKEDKR